MSDNKKFVHFILKADKMIPEFILRHELDFQRVSLVWKSNAV